MLMYYHADVLERLLFYGKPFAGALGKNVQRYLQIPRASFTFPDFFAAPCPKQMFGFGSVHHLHVLHPKKCKYSRTINAITTMEQVFTERLF